VFYYNLTFWQKGVCSFVIGSKIALRAKDRLGEETLKVVSMVN